MLYRKSSLTTGQGSSTESSGTSKLFVTASLPNSAMCSSSLVFSQLPKRAGFSQKQNHWASISRFTPTSLRLQEARHWRSKWEQRLQTISEQSRLKILRGSAPRVLSQRFCPRRYSHWVQAIMRQREN